MNDTTTFCSYIRMLPFSLLTLFHPVLGVVVAQPSLPDQENLYIDKHSTIMTLPLDDLLDHNVSNHQVVAGTSLAKRDLSDYSFTGSYTFVQNNVRCRNFFVLMITGQSSAQNSAQNGAGLYMTQSTIDATGDITIVVMDTDPNGRVYVWLEDVELLAAGTVNFSIGSNCPAGAGCEVTFYMKNVTWSSGGGWAGTRSCRGARSGRAAGWAWARR